ncbi:AMP-binding protein [Rhodococcoides kyotonense]|uniref:Acyl-CoA synthetase (AMP-forming)/AMP-acid ligase II n=1 Tax=Rhodococcoides kyotonense TaxID=398843 RepID=A0A239MLW2_9NOCA|nr:AMP-binding protein [Rhodococcus kyotonensis]SNT43084.1 Acyl-CoA synthetase (AMP-forming)/AMP-acid ligase II [Rhodococcus kyotonensis]
MTLVLGGAGDQPAFRWAGRTVTYAEFDDAIDEWPEQPVCDASELDVPTALVAVCAAARRGTAVRVENPDARPHRETIADAWLLVATSGSTGRPRPLARTVASWADSFDEFTAITGLKPEDRILITGPLHATMHLFAAVHALHIGACVTDDAESATAAHAVPAVLRRLVEHSGKLRTVVVAGTALDSGARDKAFGVDLVEYYGAAELSLVAARRVPEPLRLLDGVDARIEDGLLFVRSPYAVLGTPEWVSVGDLAELGQDGTLTVHGRGDAAIDVGGTTVLAEEVERILDGIDGIRAAAAIGTRHDVLGETVTAVIELVGDLDAVKKDARRLLQKEAVPRRWVVVDELPRTGSGKIARGRVKDLIP